MMSGDVLPAAWYLWYRARLNTGVCTGMLFPQHPVCTKDRMTICVLVGVDD